MSLDLDEQYIKEGYRLIVGCDEAGRGCHAEWFTACLSWRFSMGNYHPPSYGEKEDEC